MAKVTQHAVIGSGNGQTTATAIKEALIDVLDDGDVVGLVWQKPIPSSVEVVYDYVLDNSVPFIMYHGEDSSPVRAFREAEKGSVQKSRDPIQAALAGISGSGKVLFLWNDTENGEGRPQLIEQVFEQIDDGILVLELSGALQPIKMLTSVSAAPKGRYDDEDEIELGPTLAALVSGLDEDDPPPTGSEDDLTYTREELLNMPAPVVKGYGARRGTVATTKTAIINELFLLDEVKVAPGVKMMEDAIEENDAVAAGIETVPTQEIEALVRAASYALAHFRHMDQANAAFHTATVRYSPITFRLAEALQPYERQQTAQAIGDVHSVLAMLASTPKTLADDSMILQVHATGGISL